MDWKFKRKKRALNQFESTVLHNYFLFSQKNHKNLGTIESNTWILNPGMMDWEKWWKVISNRQYILKRMHQKSLRGEDWNFLSSVQSLSRVRLFETPWTAACQGSLSITNTQSPPNTMSIELVMPSNHLILYHPLLLLPSLFPSIRVFSNESVLCIRWPKI